MDRPWVVEGPTDARRRRIDDLERELKQGEIARASNDLGGRRAVYRATNDRAERLEEWREAEREAARARAGSARARLTQRQAANARQLFHDAEDDEHRRQGDDRPRTSRPTANEESKQA